jgi:hypothetical protein
VPINCQRDFEDDEQRTQINVPGKKTSPSTEIVFIAALSIWAASLTRREIRLSC